MEKLCPASFSILEGPCTIARHITNAQLVCHQTFAARGAAWDALAALIQADHHAQYLQEYEEEGMSGSSNSQTPEACKMPWGVYVANPLYTL